MKKRKIRGVLGTNGSEVVYLHHFDFICSRSASNCVKIEIIALSKILGLSKKTKKNKKIVSKIRVTSSLLKCPKTKNKAPLMHNLHRGGILTPIGN
jgi:hypothetical protein